MTPIDFMIDFQWKTTPGDEPDNPDAISGTMIHCLSRFSDLHKISGFGKAEKIYEDLDCMDLSFDIRRIHHERVNVRVVEDI